MDTRKVWNKLTYSILLPVSITEDALEPDFVFLPLDLAFSMIFFLWPNGMIPLKKSLKISFL